jgi:chaperone LolA
MLEIKMAETPGLRRKYIQKTTTCHRPLATGYWLLATVIIMLLCISVLVASDEEDILQKMQQRYASVKTITGSFRQLYRNPGIEQNDWSGEFWIKKPDKMKWQYLLPEKKTFIARKGRNYIYNPQDNQVTEWSEELDHTPFRFLLGSVDISKSFVVKPEYEFSKRFEGAQIVRLEPKSEVGYSFLVLEIDRDSYDLKRLIVREKDGSTNEYIFTDTKTGMKINDKEFKLNMPKDVEVLEVEYDD